MKHTLALCLALVSGSALADPYSMVLTQRNSTDTGNVTRVMTVPTSASLWFYNPSTQLPGYVTLGTGLSFTSGMLTITAASPVNADWNASSGLAQILNKPTIPAAQVNSDWASNSGVSQILNRPTLATVATSGSYNDLNTKPTIPPAITLTTTGTSGAATFNTGTGALNIPNYAFTPTARSFSYPTRALNTCFQPSSTRDTQFSYGVDITTTVTLGGTPQGTAFLRIYTDSACTTGQQTVISSTAGQPTTLSVTVGQAVIGTASLFGTIPAGFWARIETQNNSGTNTFATRQGQEVLL